MTQTTMSYTAHDEPEQECPQYTLHPLRGVVWAAFLGSPMAAGFVMAINYARAGNKSGARITAVIGVLVTVALFTVLLVTPDDAIDRLPDAVFYIPQLIIVYVIAKRLQSELIDTHLANGGPVASAWPSVGIGALCLPLVLGGIVGGMLLLEQSYGTVVEFGNDEVYYSGDATEDDARKLAGVLRDVEFFGAGGASVGLNSSAGQYTVSFVLVDNAWDNPENVDFFRDIGRALCETAFSAPLKIELCDGYFTPHEAITIE